MKVIEDNFNDKFDFCTYVALGSFDGFHLGHLKLLNKTIELSKNNNCKSMIFTFKNHPLSIINPDVVPKLLINKEKKIDIAGEIGIDILNLACFDEKFMNISPEEFINKLLFHYNIKGIIVGFNYRFGYKNLGDVELLKSLSEKKGFELHVVEPVQYQGNTISSSLIRSMIREGNIEKANILLGRPYMLEGKVIEGRKIGRTMGFPTINLDYEKKYVLPAGGVYYTNVKYNNKFYKGITNVGFNPTVNGNKLNIETNILDFNEEIYGEDVCIYFIEKIRNEKKFNSKKELSKQLEKDKALIKSRCINLI